MVKILPTIAGDDPGIEWDPTAIIEADDQGDNLQVCHSLLLQSTVNVCIGDLQDSQEEIIFYEEDYDADDDSICLSEPPDESIVFFPFSFSLWAHHDDVNLNAPIDPRELRVPENKAKIAGMHATILEVATEQHGICYVDCKLPTCYSSIKTGTLIDCGTTDGNDEFCLVHQEKGERFADVNGINDLQLSIPIADPVSMAYHGKGSIIFSNGEMEVHKIKVDGGSIHAGRQQKFETYVILSSDQNCDPSMVDYEHPSIWPENWPPNTGDAYMDKSFNTHYGVMGALLNMQLPGYEHHTQVKEVFTMKDFMFFYAYVRKQNLPSVYKHCGFQHACFLTKLHLFGWIGDIKDYDERGGWMKSSNMMFQVK